MKLLPGDHEIGEFARHAVMFYDSEGSFYAVEIDTGLATKKYKTQIGLIRHLTSVCNKKGWDQVNEPVLLIDEELKVFRGVFKRLAFAGRRNQHKKFVLLVNRKKVERNEIHIIPDAEPFQELITQALVLDKTIAEAKKELLDIKRVYCLHFGQSVSHTWECKKRITKAIKTKRLSD